LNDTQFCGLLSKPVKQKYFSPDCIAAQTELSRHSALLIRAGNRLHESGHTPSPAARSRAVKSIYPSSKQPWESFGDLPALGREHGPRLRRRKNKATTDAELAREKRFNCENAPARSLLRCPAREPSHPAGKPPAPKPGR
jgi:hypothetical protein